jgi:hypothetical protein
MQCGNAIPSGFGLLARHAVWRVSHETPRSVMFLGRQTSIVRLRRILSNGLVESSDSDRVCRTLSSGQWMSVNNAVNLFSCRLHVNDEGNLCLLSKGLLRRL